MSQKAEAKSSLSIDTSLNLIHKNTYSLGITTPPSQEEENKDIPPTITGEKGFKSTLEVLDNDLIFQKTDKDSYGNFTITRVWFIEGDISIPIYTGFINMSYAFGLPDNIIIGSRWCSGNGYYIVLFYPKTSTYLFSSSSRSFPIIRFKLIDEEHLIILSNQNVEVWHFSTLEYIRTLSSEAKSFDLANDGKILILTKNRKIEIWNPKTGTKEDDTIFENIGSVLCLTPEICIYEHPPGRLIIQNKENIMNLDSSSGYRDIFVLNYRKVLTIDLKGLIKIYDLNTLDVTIQKKNPYIHREANFKLLRNSNRIIIQKENKVMIWDLDTDVIETIYEGNAVITNFGTLQDGRIYVLFGGTIFRPPTLRFITYSQ
jgi:hypothetical protein